NFIPPMRLHEISISDSFALMMTLQTSDIGRSVFSQGKNELATRKSFIQLAVDRKPRPVFKRFKLLSLFKNLVNLISFYFHRKVHIVRVMFVAKTSQAITE